MSSHEWFVSVTFAGLGLGCLASSTRLHRMVDVSAFIHVDCAFGFLTGLVPFPLLCRAGQTHMQPAHMLADGRAGVRGSSVFVGVVPCPECVARVAFESPWAVSFSTPLMS